MPIFCRKIRMQTLVTIMVFWVVACSAKAETCRVEQTPGVVEITSPQFTYRLRLTGGLRAESMLNRITGRMLRLAGPEVEFDIGLPGQTVQTPELSSVSVVHATAADVLFQLADKDADATVTVRYVCDEKTPVLRKFVTITNTSRQTWERLLNVRLGTYQTDVAGGDADPDFPVPLNIHPQKPEMGFYEDPAGRVRGFPAYVARQFFFALAHPAGFATRQGAKVSLRQYPGIRLEPGQSFECMEAVYGVSQAEQARIAFQAHLVTRMRRVVRGHDKPYAIFEGFGGWPEGTFDNDENKVQASIDKVIEGDRDSDCHFDIMSLEFWNDVRGDFKHPDPQRFPHDFDPILKRLREIGTSPGLWVDSGGLPEWTIGSNPAIQDAYTDGPGKGGICRADKTVNQYYVDGFVYQIHHNGVKLLKFDNFGWPDFYLDPVCNNPKHDHLPGIYSTEAIENAAIGVYKALGQEDVFIMLYWGYRSPWWLLYADTLFDAGMKIEASSFAEFPAAYARQSTIRREDQARWMLKDIPPLGWDTLGTWLADWEWNSRIGTARWQDSVLMDISRGHLLAQIWSDQGWLSPPGRAQMGDFIKLLKGAEPSFRNCRFIYGNPWKDEAYGHLCSDGERAFVAIDNAAWNDRTFRLELNPQWGLPPGKFWKIYRWYPAPAPLQAQKHTLFREQASIPLRAFETVLLEIVPSGEQPTLARDLPKQEIAGAFAEKTVEVPLAVSDHESPHPPGRLIELHGSSPQSRVGGLLVVSVELRDNGNPYWIKEQGKAFTLERSTLNGTAIAAVAALSEGNASPWQSWRIEVPPSSSSQAMDLSVKTTVPSNIQLIAKGHFIPNESRASPK
jgi:hypothetical protein